MKIQTTRIPSKPARYVPPREPSPLERTMRALYLPAIQQQIEQSSVALRFFARLPKPPVPSDEQPYVMDPHPRKNIYPRRMDRRERMARRAATRS